MTLSIYARNRHTGNIPIHKKAKKQAQYSETRLSTNSDQAPNSENQFHVQDTNRAITSLRQPTFQSFTKLPAELRNMIYELAIPGPRTIRIKGAAMPDENDDHYVAASATTDVPALLHVCNESRSFGLKYYTLAFKRHLCDRPIYMDFDRDTLFFVDWSTFAAFTSGSTSHFYKKDVVAHLKHLIIGGIACRIGDYKKWRLENLSTLTLGNCTWGYNTGLATQLRNFWALNRSQDNMPVVYCMTKAEEKAMCDA